MSEGLKQPGIPASIQIGCYQYQVIETAKPLVLNGKECGGTINYREQIIEISNQMGPQAMEQTFWHEVVHAIVHYRNVSLKEASEETIVDEIATGLYGLMKTNGLLPGQKEGGA